jgi:hypothetical protein
MLSSEDITLYHSLVVKSAILLSAESVLCPFENAAQIDKSGLVKLNKEFTYSTMYIELGTIHIDNTNYFHFKVV